MKKLVALVLGIALVVSLVSCGKDESSNVVDSTAPSNDPLHFIYVSPLLAHPVWLMAKDGFDQACLELGIQGDWVGPQNISPEEMAKLVETAVAQKANAIITQGLVPANPVDIAIKAGIPALIVDSDIVDVDRLAFFGKDVGVQAKLLYDNMVGQLGKNTKLYVSIQVAALNYQIAHDQINSIEAILKTHPGGYEIVNISESKSDKMKSITEWENTLKAYPEINVCINLAAEAGPGCAAVVKDLDLKDNILVYAVDDIDETLALIKEGFIDGTIVTSFWNYGYQSTYWLYQHITEGKTPATVINDAGTILVNNENINAYGDILKEKVDL